MNLIWLKRLKQIQSSDLEDTGGEVDPQLALELCTLCLRCSSQHLAVQRVTVWKRAKRTWERNFPVVNLVQNHVQNYVYGTFYTREDRLVDFEKSDEEINALLFRIEEVLLEIHSTVNEDDDEMSTATTGTSKQARLWTKSRKGMSTMRELVSKALNLDPALPPSNNNTHATRCNEIRDFLFRVIFTLEQNSTDVGTLDPHHIPVWHRINTKYLPSVRQVLLIAVGITVYLYRDAIGPALDSFQNFVEVKVIEPGIEALKDIFTSAQTEAEKKESAFQDAVESRDRMLHMYNFNKMSDVSRSFEEQMTHPMFNALFGNLVSIGLIQAQAVKAEGLGLSANLDKILDDNKFNTRLLVALPAAFAAMMVVRYSYDFGRYLFGSSEEFELVQRSNTLDPIKLVLWEIETLLIREDDGPALFSNVNNVEEWGDGEGDGVMETSEIGEGVMSQRQFARIMLGGQLVCKMQHFMRLLIQSKSNLFKREPERYYRALESARNLFPREGWSANARILLVQSLQRQF